MRWYGLGLGLDNRDDAPLACMLRPGLEISKCREDMTSDDLKKYFNSWFYGKRSTFGKNGWEDFMGDAIDVYQVDGGELCHAARPRQIADPVTDHFSMMVPPYVRDLGQIVVSIIKKATVGAV
jgi:hypothetical protein